MAHAIRKWKIIQVIIKSLILKVNLSLLLVEIKYIKAH